jgi:hypothetical protein
MFCGSVASSHCPSREITDSAGGPLLFISDGWAHKLLTHAAKIKMMAINSFFNGKRIFILSFYCLIEKYNT